MTFNELLNLALEIANQRRAFAAGNAGKFEAGRDFSIAITAIEDALTRYNSGMYHLAGTWKRADPDADV